MSQMKKRTKIDLGLGGGGARDIAHIGVLKVLKQEKIPIDLIGPVSDRLWAPLMR